MSSIRLPAVAALLGAGLLAAGCTSTSDSDDDGFVSGDGSITVVEPADREPAPVVSGTTLEGEPLTLADYAGQVVVLNTWASWCGPCRAETDDLVAVAKEFTGDVQFIGVNIRNDDAAAEAFVQSQGIPYPSIHDPASEALLGFTDLPPIALPTTYVIDADGRVAARALTPLTQGTLSGVLEDVLADG